MSGSGKRRQNYGFLNSNDYLWPTVKSPKSLVSLSLKWAPLSKAQKQVNFNLSNLDLFVPGNTCSEELRKLSTVSMYL